MAHLPHDLCVRLADSLDWRDRARLSMVDRALRRDLHTAEHWRVVTIRFRLQLPSKELAEALRSAGDHARDVRELRVLGLPLSPYACTGRINLFRLSKRMRSYFPKDSELEELVLSVNSGAYATHTRVGGELRFQHHGQADTIGCCAPLARFKNLKRIRIVGGTFPLCRLSAADLVEHANLVHVDAEHLLLVDPEAAEYLSVLSPRTVEVFFANRAETTRHILNGLGDCDDCVRRVVLHNVCTFMLTPEVVSQLRDALALCTELREVEIRNGYLTDRALASVCRGLPPGVATLAVRNNMNARKRGLRLVAHALGESTVLNAQWSREEAARFAARAGA